MVILKMEENVKNPVVIWTKKDYLGCLIERENLPQPERVAFPKPPKAPDGSLMYERVPNKVPEVPPLDKIIGHPGLNPTAAASPSLKKRTYEEMNGIDMASPHQPPSIPAAPPRSEQYQILMAAAAAAAAAGSGGGGQPPPPPGAIQPMPRHVAQINGKPKIAHVTRTAAGRKQLRESNLLLNGNNMKEYLNEDHLTGFDNYKYCPKSVAPNLLTFTGFLFTVIAYLVFTALDYNYYASDPDHPEVEPLPRWVFMMAAIFLFLAYTLVMAIIHVIFYCLTVKSQLETSVTAIKIFTIFQGLRVIGTVMMVLHRNTYRDAQVEVVSISFDTENRFLDLGIVDDYRKKIIGTFFINGGFMLLSISLAAYVNYKSTLFSLWEIFDSVYGVAIITVPYLIHLDWIHHLLFKLDRGITVSFFDCKPVSAFFDINSDVAFKCPPLLMACRQIEHGVQAIFGPSDPILGAHVQSICEALDVPHIEARMNIEPSSKELSINLHPGQDAMNIAYKDLMSFQTPRSNENTLSRKD
ncbi:unnamed protein product [Callosobruchus maculatus]|uniref:Uncharacterized protein n=1 Tax=Callosobruchus maculatus TaxID=64391 RepID=A0A653BF45_CALMS|nr:unnamed protein product [Callosobruchus maculatus]